MTKQIQMNRHLGMAPSLDADGIIDNISYKRNVVAKLVDYTVKAEETGTLFTTIGATADVNFTLPTAADGLEFWFINSVDVELMVTSAPADKMIVFNDAAADTIAFTDASKQIGSGVVCISDGTYWHVFTVAANAGSMPAPATITT